MTPRRQSGIPEKHPQQHHGVGTKPVPDHDWQMLKQYDAWMRKPILQPDPVRFQLRLIVNKYFGQEAA